MENVDVIDALWDVELSIVDAEHQEWLAEQLRKKHENG